MVLPGLVADRKGILEVERASWTVRVALGEVDARFLQSGSGGCWKTQGVFLGLDDVGDTGVDCYWSHFELCDVCDVFDLCEYEWLAMTYDLGRKVLLHILLESSPIRHTLLYVCRIFMQIHNQWRSYKGASCNEMQI